MSVIMLSTMSFFDEIFYKDDQWASRLSKSFLLFPPCISNSRINRGGPFRIFFLIKSWGSPPSGRGVRSCWRRPCCPWCGWSSSVDSAEGCEEFFEIQGVLAVISQVIGPTVVTRDINNKGTIGHFTTLIYLITNYVFEHFQLPFFTSNKNRKIEKPKIYYPYCISNILTKSLEKKRVDLNILKLILDDTFSFILGRINSIAYSRFLTQEA